MTAKFDVLCDFPDRMSLGNLILAAHLNLQIYCILQIYNLLYYRNLFLKYLAYSSKNQF